MLDMYPTGTHHLHLVTLTSLMHMSMSDLSQLLKDLYASQSELTPSSAPSIFRWESPGPQDLGRPASPNVMTHNGVFSSMQPKASFIPIENSIVRTTQKFPFNISDIVKSVSDSAAISDFSDVSVEKPNDKIFQLKRKTHQL